MLQCNKRLQGIAMYIIKRLLTTLLTHWKMTGIHFPAIQVFSDNLLFFFLSQFVQTENILASKPYHLCVLCMEYRPDKPITIFQSQIRQVAVHCIFGTGMKH